ncbi:MAG: hypothetical protein MI739_14505 [Bacteroidales bacterium]|nr:hypothetical protein [Bacteroidales bacterium]
MKRLIFLTSLFIVFIQKAQSQANYPILFLENQFEKIIKEVNSKEPNTDASDIFWKAQALRKIGKDSRALVLLKESTQRFVQQEKLNLLYIDILFDNSMYTKAEPLIDKVLLSDSTNFDLLQKKILISEFNLKYNKAIDILNKAIEHDSLNIFYLSHLGDNYKRIDNTILSGYYYKKAYKQNKYNLNIAKKLIGYYLKKNPAKAVNICDTILNTDSLNIAFLRYKAFAFFKMKKFKEALNGYQKIYSLGDSSVSVLKKIGISRYKIDDFDGSQLYLEQALKKDTTDSEITFYYGCSYAYSPYKYRALRYFFKTIELLEPNKQVLVAIYDQIAFTYRNIHEYDKSLDYYQKIYKLDPSKSKCLFSIASIYDNNLKQKVKAKEYYELFLARVGASLLADTTAKPGKVTYVNSAIHSIKEINEELFFEGKLNNSKKKK